MANIRFDPTELRKYGGLTLVARTLVEGFITGVHKSPYKGFSVEFAEHRQYYPGDEIRHIDWRAYGKTDRYYIKEYEEETNLKSYLLVDASGSMAFRGAPGQPSKFEYAQYVAASLSYMMLHQMDAVGLITHDTKVRSLIPPHANTKHLLQLISTLEKTTPGDETSMGKIWHELAAHHLKRRGMVFILSDFFDNIDSLVRALQHLRHRRHEVVLLQILAPEEIEFPYSRMTQFRNLEIGANKLLVDPRRIREEYLKNFENFCTTLRRKAGDLKIDYHLLRTDQPADRALGIYLTVRNQRA
ncbi:DUF58 domain-containing protein [Tuwongella immobilis]|uniref:DUF58 domain-containing protein n=1 Tax=Tuwongella immobilis TaxID=692036 RepID=A0A6C2YR68_9BACT|nr:DUF58 domain-containing protein [Tuwongella immobilis]VIP04140.1 Uncharacterized protein OS=Planctomyces brasiliensis (strain ATCC 49424 / DSM 5305 / JCM 21570 / NBRC 103401 / IFAM 1448) GN=Plabr_2557 PE=4 SV=1: DUF58 [Tuwongella immobilis]VTS05645.1 Uncharacterized protein OS=Planctomyces brasiliensis (strain ATCC 49424 / DSM 5305 / JCM 21570 / NBRC 103401 / IFAM 1448) GN=Plabr_2557 PE=4 SV=1: DUF58 [Tuwongella immobilis]